MPSLGPLIRTLAINTLWGTIFALSMVCGTIEGAEPTSSATLLLTNGNVLTPAGWVSSVAVDQGIIVAVGDAEAVEPFRTARTRTIDLEGATLLPGLHDSHVHPMFAGLEQYACGFPAGASPETIAAAISICVAQKSPGDWITGGNWVAAVFEAGQQTRAFLDELAPANPVLLNDEAHHSVWVNSMALAHAGISAATQDPEGGIIERDASGEPTGLLRESATRLVEAVVPQPSFASRAAALTLATNQMLSYGITSFTIASVREPDIEPLSTLSANGAIKQRMRGCIVWKPDPETSNRATNFLIDQRANFAQPRFATDCVKIFLDGVPTESHTGAMLAPYENTLDERGMLLIPTGVLERAVAEFDRQGLIIKFHAAGDAAVRAGIDAVAYARKVNGFGGPMHHIGHSTFVDTADIPRVQALQMAWEFSPYIWYPTPMAATDILRAVGHERMQRWVPIRDAVDTGALVTAGSDWSVVPSVNPWLAMETLVTRQKPGGSEETLGVDQAIPLDTALHIFTENGSRLMGHRQLTGSIEVGMHADLIITETNPFAVPIHQVHTTRVMMTFIDGELVFDAANPPELTAF